MNGIRKSFYAAIIGALLLTAAPVKEAKGIIIIAQIIREAIVWVIKAVNLMLQRLQNETLWLQNAAKVIENKLSALKLGEIADWTDRQRQLYQKYYDDLWKIRSTLETYSKISAIVDRQRQILKLYSFTWGMVSQDNHFSSSELDYMYRVYTGIISDSLYNIDQLLLVINSYRLQMSDAKRLAIIHKAGEGIDQNYSDLQKFNNQNIQLSINRARDKNEVQSIRKLYGLPTQ